MVSIWLVLSRKTVVQQDRVEALHDNIIFIIIIIIINFNNTMSKWQS